MPDNVIKTTIELTGEESYSQKMRTLAANLKNVNSEQKAVEAQYGKGASSLAALTAKQSAYQDKLEVQKQKMQTIREEYERVVEAEGENSAAAQRLATAYNNASADVARTERELADLEASMKDAGNATKEAAEKAKAAKEAWSKIGDVVQDTAMKMAKALAGVTSAAVAVSMKSFMDYEQGVAKVGTLVDQTVMPLERMSEAMLAVSDATGMAATDVTEAVYSALSSGVDTANAAGFVETAAKAAKAGFADLDVVVDGSTSAINAWGLAYSDAQKVFESMLVAQNEGKTTLGELASGIGQVTGVAPQLNVSLNEVMAAVAALTKNGVSTSSAFTGLKAVMSNVIKPTKQASDEAKRLGLDFSAAALQSKGLTGFLADVMDKTKGDSESLAKLFGSVEGLSQVMLLGGAAAEDYAHALGSMGDSAGLLDQAYGQVSDTRAEKLNKALNSMKNNAIKFGQSLAPYIDMASDALGRLSDRISQMSEGDMMKLLNTALWTTGALAVVGSIGKITEAVSTLKTAFSGISLLMSGPAGWIPLAIAGVGALGVGLAALSANTETLADKFDKSMFELDLENAEAGYNIGINADVTMNTTEGEIQAKGKQLCDELVGALTDGIPDTPEVMEELQGKVEGYFSGVVEKVNQWAAEEIGKLDVDSETYDQDVANIEAKASQMTAALQQQEAAAQAWLQSMAGKSAEYVKQHVGELEQILGMVNDITAAIDQATGNTTTMDIVKKGIAADSQTAGQAFGEAGAKRTQALTTNKENYLGQLEQLKQDYADGKLGKGAEAEKAYNEQAKALKEQFEASNEAIMAEYQKDIAELMNGLGESLDLTNPEFAKQLKTAAAGMDVQSLLDNVFAGNGEINLENLTPEMTAALEQALAESGANMSLEDFVERMNAGTIDPEVFGSVTASLQQAMMEALGNTEGFEFIPEVLQTLIEQGVFDGIDGLEGMNIPELLQKMFTGEIEVPIVPEVEPIPPVNQPTETITATADTSGAQSSIDAVTGKEVEITTEADLSGAKDAKKAVDAVKDKTVTIKTKYEQEGKPPEGYAHGGRATSASIFGEAGPEWAIPEKHNARTAELLMAAMRASGFTFSELARTTGRSAGVSANLMRALNGVSAEAQGIVDGMTAQTRAAAATQTATGGSVSHSTVNVFAPYSGAYNRNEARRFGLALADQTSAALRVKGG